MGHPRAHNLMEGCERVESHFSTLIQDKLEAGRHEEAATDAATSVLSTGDAPALKAAHKTRHVSKSPRICR